MNQAVRRLNKMLWIWQVLVRTMIGVHSWMRFNQSDLRGTVFQSNCQWTSFKWLSYCSLLFNWLDAKLLFSIIYCLLNQSGLLHLACLRHLGSGTLSQRPRFALALGLQRWVGQSWRGISIIASACLSGLTFQVSQFGWLAMIIFAYLLLNLSDCSDCHFHNVI